MNTQKRSYRNALCFLAIFLVTVTASGCGGGSTDSSYYGGGDGGGSAAQGYSVSGTLRDSITNNPVQGAVCSLLQTKDGNIIEEFLKTPKETVTAGTATTDQYGQYSFTGVPSGTYTLKFTKTDYVTLEVEDLSVTQDTTGIDRQVVQTSQWTQMTGAGYPYDTTMNYLIVQAELPAKGPEWQASQPPSPLRQA